MTTPQPLNALDTLDRHWAVKVVSPEERAAAIQYGMGVLSRLVGGESVNGSPAPPEFVVPLAGAYVIAASEWLDFEGAASPSAQLSAEQEARRAAHMETGARFGRSLERLHKGASAPAHPQRDPFTLQPEVGRVEVRARETRGASATALEPMQGRVPQQQRHCGRVQRKLELDFGRNGFSSAPSWLDAGGRGRASGLVRVFHPPRAYGLGQQG